MFGCTFEERDTLSVYLENLNILFTFKWTKINSLFSGWNSVDSLDLTKFTHKDENCCLFKYERLPYQLSPAGLAAAVLIFVLKSFYFI